MHGALQLIRVGRTLWHCRRATAGLEFAWYALATRINPWRVLSANLDFSFGPRPAEWVLICGLAVVATCVLSRLRFGPRRA